MTAIAEPLPTEPLWTRARAMFARAVAAIGAAAAIAAIGALSKSLRRDIVAWLCPLEHVVRKLVLAEAAELHRAGAERARRRLKIEHIPLRGMALHVGKWSARPPAAQSTKVAAVSVNAPPEASRSNVDKADPETWRAPFSFALPRDPRLPNARAPRIRALWGPTPPPPPPRTPRIIRPEDAPFRLARRFEALRRVLEDPRPHAERLARLLAREIPRSRQLVLRYVFAPCRSNAFDPHDPRLGIDAMGAAFVRTETAFADSS
jgi:hypothetical protein